MFFLKLAIIFLLLLQVLGKSDISFFVCKADVGGSS